MIVFIIQLSGAVALLLWAVRMIRTGVERAFLNGLRVSLRKASGGKVTALIAGALSAITLQSSTAVAMLAASFATAGTLAFGTGVFILLGADVGSAIVAQILFSPVNAIAPLLLVVGVTLFMKGTSRQVKQFGRILVGLALVLVSLTMIRTATLPLQSSDVVKMVLGYLSRDLASAFVIGAFLAWALHSSVAAVLMFATFALEGMLLPSAAAALVLGANLGGAMIPVILTSGAALAARRLVLANLIIRGGGALVALFVLVVWTDGLTYLGQSAHRQAINLHLAFNITVALAALPIAPLIGRLTNLILPNGGASNDAVRESALDPTALSDPDRALACATREALGMGEKVYSMLSQSLGMLRQWDQGLADVITERENEVDRNHFEIKLYIARLQESRLNGLQSRRAMDIASLANHFEDAGDQISSALLDIAQRMSDEQLSFSEEGWHDLTDFHDQVMSNAQLGLNVLLTGDEDAARQLVEEKDRTRAAEQRLQERHLARLRNGNDSSLDTSNLHQNTIRALKQVNTAFTYAAYPIAEEAGDLLSSRLATPVTGDS